MTGFNNWHLVVGHPRAGRWVCKTEVAQNTSRHCVYLQTLRNTSILGLFYSSHFIFILGRKTYFGSALPINLEVTAWFLGWVSWSCLKIGDISVIYMYILILFCVCVVADLLEITSSNVAATFFTSPLLYTSGVKWVALCKYHLCPFHVRLANSHFPNCCSGSKEHGLISCCF